MSSIPQHTVEPKTNDDVVEAIRTDSITILESKRSKYGDSTKYFGLHSMLDQILIKLLRVKNLSEGNLKIRVEDEPVNESIMSVLNYAILIMVDDFELPMDKRETKDYDMFQADIRTIHKDCEDIRRRKNHDYGEAWTVLRYTTLIDLAMVKVMRCHQILDDGGSVSDIEDNLYDIMNYAIYAIIRNTESHRRGS